MIEFLLLLAALFATGPWLDAGHDARLNACYRPDPRWHGFVGPCKPEMTIGRQDTPSRRREDWR